MNLVNGTLTVLLTSSAGASIYLLSTSSSAALSLSGNAQLKVGGVLDVDSNSSSAISASGNPILSATGGIQVVGKVQSSGNAHLSPSPVTGIASFGDPLATLPVPSTSTGVVNTLMGSLSVSGNSTQMIFPGIYSQMQFSGSAVVTFKPGIYVITGGGLSVSGNATLNGSGVMIYNTGSTYTATSGDGSGGTFGAVSFSGNAQMNLTPSTSGTYANILFFQSRSNAKPFTLSGNADPSTPCVIYALTAPVALSGNSVVGGQFQTTLVASTLNLSGNAIFQLANDGTGGFSPAQIRTAYGISNLAYDGTGQTIAIIDAYDNPAILQSIDTFDTQFGLTNSGASLLDQYGPASSFLTVLNQNGQAAPLPATDPTGAGGNNWEVETALDAEWIHAIAPGADLLLVEANGQTLPDLMAAVATAAAQPGVSVVSMSWGFLEGQAALASDEALYDQALTTPAGHQGVTFVASSGDYGSAYLEYPALSPNVVSVGGTSLKLNANNSYNSELGWGYLSSSLGTLVGSGGGVSQYELEPNYQLGVQSTGHRTAPDVSFFADQGTGAWIADSYNLSGASPFEIVGGTSLSAPNWAGLFALVNQGRAAAGQPTLNTSVSMESQQTLYSLAQVDYNVITSGSNGGYNAAAGYNLVSGLGSPIADRLVSDLIAGNYASSGRVAPIRADLNANPGFNESMGSSGATNVMQVFAALVRGTEGAPAALHVLDNTSLSETPAGDAIAPRPETLFPTTPRAAESIVGGFAVPTGAGSSSILDMTSAASQWDAEGDYLTALFEDDNPNSASARQKSVVIRENALAKPDDGVNKDAIDAVFSSVAAKAAAMDLVLGETNLLSVSADGSTVLGTL